MQTNTITRNRRKTHEGAPAKAISPYQQLCRSTCAALLWENEFYEDGVTIAERVYETALKCDAQDVAALAVRLRTEFKLRHMPLLVCAALVDHQDRAKVPGMVRNVIADTIRRPDEMGEILSIHAGIKGVPLDEIKKALPAQMKKGIAQAFGRFDPYQLAKYDRKGRAIKLKDIMRLCHPKPADEKQAGIWKQLLEGTLESADTWEVGLSKAGQAGAEESKKDVFDRLLRSDKMGYLALLRNLRNMEKAGVDTELIEKAVLERKGAWKVFPFRYIAAARAVPRFEPAIDKAMIAAIAEMPAFDGETVILVDVSWSMSSKLSEKSDMTRRDAACALAAIWPGRKRLFSFSNDLVEVPPRSGMSAVDAISASQYHGGTLLGAAVRLAIENVKATRLVVISDEQSHDPVPDPFGWAKGEAYMINVASAKNGVGYGAWHHIDGFSENVLTWMREFEKIRAIEKIEA